MPSRDLSIDLTAREREFFDAVSKEALFALARASMQLAAGIDWIEGAEARLRELADDGEISAKALPRQSRHKNHVVSSRRR
jgi:hypothetical protein